MKPSGIGGQAVMEGVMMKNKSEYAVAVRKSDNKIEIKKDKVKSDEDRPKFLKLPIIRGVVNFVDSLMLGVSTLTYSASFFEEEEDVQPTKMEKALEKVFKGKAEAVTMGLCVALSLVIAIGMFMILPMFISNKIGSAVDNTSLQILLEGVIRIALFVLYVVLISFMKDIKRTFMYHGAEHKAINCIENGLDLTVENVRKQSKQHKRCGTSFLLIVMFISVIFFMFIRCKTVWLKIILRLLLVPVIAGVSYEFLKLCGRSESKIVYVLSRPGMWLQRLTTKEPDDSMIEVAIASVEAVFDWKQFVEEVRADKEKKKQEKKAKRRSSKESLDKANSNFYTNYRQDGYAEYDTDEDEVDEILNALDKMFIDKEEQDGEFEAKPSVDSEPTFRRSTRYLNQEMKKDSLENEEIMDSEEVMAQPDEAKEETQEEKPEDIKVEAADAEVTEEVEEAVETEEGDSDEESDDKTTEEEKESDTEESDAEEVEEALDAPQENNCNNTNSNQNKNNNRNNNKHGKKKRRKKKR